MKYKGTISDIGSIVINFLRPEVTIKCLESLREQTPDLNIYVGDQDDDNKLLKDYCESRKINYVKLPFDCGIGTARNTLVKHAKKDGCKYIMWGDNDFVYDSRFRLQNALTILNKDKKVGIVGGTILKNDKVQHYERVIYYNEFYKTACFIPLEYTYPEVHYAKKVDYYYCDMTFNFCVARIEIFNEKVKWDNDIKVKFEHSVVENTPIIYKYKDKITVGIIADLFPPSMRKCCTNNYTKENLYIWTEFGWEKVKQIHQHYVKNKQMSKILTRNSYIDLTTDHSLVIQGKKIKPTQLNVEDKIENLLYPQLSNKLDVNKEWAWMLGFFLAEGHCSKGKPNKLEITNQNLDDLNRCKKTLEKFGFSSKYWNVRERKDKCHFFVFDNNPCLFSLFSQFYNLNREKIIPSFVYEWNKSSRKAFLEGFLKGDGYKVSSYKTAFCQKSPVTVQGILTISRDIFPYFTLYKLSNKYGCWFKVDLFKEHKSIQKKKLLKPKNNIIQKEDYTLSGYVYDIAIENKHHSFGGGIGNVNLHNSFYFLKFLQHSKLKVAYCPSMMVKHEHGKSDIYNKYRNRVSDGEIYAKKLNLKTGFAINEISWNHTNQKQMDFRRVAVENPTFISALKHNHMNESIQKISNKQINNKNLVFYSILNIVQYLKDKNIYFVIVDKSCLQAVRNGKFYDKEKTLYIASNQESIHSILIKDGFRQGFENEYILGDYKILLSAYSGNTKKFMIEYEEVNVPFPVISYVAKIFGKKWESIDIS